MRRTVLVLAVMALVGCQSGDNAGAGPAESRKGAAPNAAPDAKGRTAFVHCLDLIREDRFAEALPVCRQALKENPGDKQIERAIEIAEEETS